MTRTTTTLTIDDEQGTIALATRLAAHLRAGDVVLLDGSLAAGKTFFTRALVRAMGCDEDVTSPTYTIANIYDGPAFPILHVDAYRLKGTQEFYHLGLDDYFETGVSLIEWGTRIEGFFDAPLSIHIGFGDTDTARTVTVAAGNARWDRVLTDLEAAP
ncbi:tRNA (adenosine(37)-N6)-threonylcarbamoyltransferase complex ATPase subunit type 1 TsaE [Celeribacter sp.]|uniref:tRNA (adenosine(37)-N6)-threonylcarbamoyltransferase complex ATPase subunit type 1 TsaE n=1 Tax=Celeribacter sp. TaxID=1890673 RepID=UPI003A8DCB80